MPSALIKWSIAHETLDLAKRFSLPSPFFKEGGNKNFEDKNLKEMKSLLTGTGRAALGNICGILR